MFWNINKIYFFFFSIQNIESNCEIIALSFFNHLFSVGKFIPFQLYLFIKGLISVILLFFANMLFYSLISSWFNATVTSYWKHLSFLLITFVFFCFLYNQENLYMIHHDSRFILWYYNTINENNRRQTHYFSSIFLNYFDIYYGVI